jgi:hypothetical protein
MRISDPTGARQESDQPTDHVRGHPGNLHVANGGDCLCNDVRRAQVLGGEIVE